MPLPCAGIPTYFSSLCVALINTRIFQGGIKECLVDWRMKSSLPIWHSSKAAPINVNVSGQQKNLLAIRLRSYYFHFIFANDHAPILGSRPYTWINAYAFFFWVLKRLSKEITVCHSIHSKAVGTSVQYAYFDSNAYFSKIMSIHLLYPNPNPRCYCSVKFLSAQRNDAGGNHWNIKKYLSD